MKWELPKDGSHKPSYQPSMELRAKYTIFAEGCRGHLGKQLIQQFSLDENKIHNIMESVFKEIWDIDPSNHKEGSNNAYHRLYQQEQ